MPAQVVRFLGRRRAAVMKVASCRQIISAALPGRLDPFLSTEGLANQISTVPTSALNSVQAWDPGRGCAAGIA